MEITKNKKHILVAPLNWGLGHATRCIPIINALLAHNFEPIIASDGYALDLLKKEFPLLQSFELPSYNITYSKKGENFKIKLLKETPHILKTIKKEKIAIRALVETYKIVGIISDNRFGVKHNKIPSVFITHQLRVLSGNTTWLSSKIHRNIISKFDECWIPDNEGNTNLSGKLGHDKRIKIPIKYLGPLSRFNKQNLKTKYNLLVLLSGPEPQRTFLEEKLFAELKRYKGRVLFVKGIVELSERIEIRDHITIYNFMTSKTLEKAINESEIILSRSGYTTIMDLAKLEKRGFFIPTPGQFEQNYLAKLLKDKRIVPYSSQDEFKIEMLTQNTRYTGFKSVDYKTDYIDLFRLF